MSDKSGIANPSSSHRFWTSPCYQPAYRRPPVSTRAIGESLSATRLADVRKWSRTTCRVLTASFLSGAAQQLVRTLSKVIMVLSNGVNGHHASADEHPWPSRNERGYEIPDQVCGTMHHRKVICVGAGISGICLAHEIDTKGTNLDLQVYEVASG